jgi:hypothetical protein
MGDEDIGAIITFADVDFFGTYREFSPTFSQYGHFPARDFGKILKKYEKYHITRVDSRISKFPREPNEEFVVQ